LPRGEIVVFLNQLVLTFSAVQAGGASQQVDRILPFVCEQSGDILFK
jgi:hypothetical protein